MRASAQRRERDHGQELDRGDRAERQAVDGEVEAAVHERQHAAPGHEQPARLAVELRQHAPGPPPDGEDERGGGDAQPGHAEHVHPREQQHREGRAEVVEDGADDEVQVRRRPGRGTARLCNHTDRMIGRTRFRTGRKASYDR